MSKDVRANCLKLMQIILTFTKAFTCSCSLRQYGVSLQMVETNGCYQFSSDWVVFGEAPGVIDHNWSIIFCISSHFASDVTVIVSSSSFVFSFTYSLVSVNIKLGYLLYPNAFLTCSDSFVRTNH